jgi:hypothetical protein
MATTVVKSLRDSRLVAYRGAIILEVKPIAKRRVKKELLGRGEEISLTGLQVGFS